MAFLEAFQSIDHTCLLFVFPRDELWPFLRQQQQQQQQQQCERINRIIPHLLAAQDARDRLSEGPGGRAIIVIVVVVGREPAANDEKEEEFALLVFSSLSCSNQRRPKGIRAPASPKAKEGRAAGGGGTADLARGAEEARDEGGGRIECRS
jgi:hypothetical protein